MKHARVLVLTAVTAGLMTFGLSASARSHHHHHVHHERVVTRQILLLTPGTGYDYGNTYQSQVGDDHYVYWKKLRDEGKIEMAGFFHGSQGEMIIAAPGVSSSEMNTLANGDPAVKSLIVTPEVRSWMLTLRAKEKKHDLGLGE